MSLKTIYDADGEKLECVEYNGGMYPVGPFTDLRLTLPYLKDFQGRDDDIVILTYPKSGTHWIREVCSMLVRGKVDISPVEELTMLEFTLPTILDELPSPRLLSTHVKPIFYPRDLVKRKCRIIDLKRNPKDVMVSKYHHLQAFYGYKGTFNAYFELFMSENDYFGPWFDYTRKWATFFEDHEDISVLSLTYEDMKTDLKSCVDKLDSYMGTNVPEDVKKRIANRCLFQNMRDKPVPTALKHLLVSERNPFFRKGIVGDWKTHFNVAQNEHFNERYQQEMKGFSLNFEKYL